MIVKRLKEERGIGLAHRRLDGTIRRPGDAGHGPIAQ